MPQKGYWKLITLIAVMLVSICGNAQMLKVITHPILDRDMVVTNWFTFINKPKRFDIDARMTRENGKYSLQVRIDEQLHTHLISPGMALGFFSKGKKLVALVCDDGTQSRNELDHIKYPISLEQLDILVNNTIDEIVMEYDKGFMKDKYTKAYQDNLTRAILLIRDQTIATSNVVAITGWIDVFHLQNPKAKADIRFITEGSKNYLQLKIFGRDLVNENRLNIYSNDEKISLFADSVYYENPKISGRNYSFARFPISEKESKFLSTCEFTKLSLQTKGEKIIVTDIVDIKGLKKISRNSYTIWFEK